MRRQPAAHPLALLLALSAAPAAAEPAFTLISDAAALSFGVAAVAMIAALAAATRLVLRGPRR